MNRGGHSTPDNWSIPSWKEPICDVIERPWANNLLNVSAIPAGQYTAFARSDATKSWMTNINRSYCLQLNGVRDRTAIQFHYGQDEAWSQGCFIVGDHIADNVTIGGLSGAYCSVENGENAIARLRATVEATDVDGSQIQIAVSDRETLFLNANQGC